MGNSKSKKMKITQSDGQATEGNRERINSIKTDSPDVNVANKSSEIEKASELMEEKNNDNASSASTVEALDEK
ncbi:jg24100 [Pararge aegeria aegeria]|uniref:Jg24100 protein n=1 Tax=Pararge aegeria aegeria TaxID=348720 RepID=A0A8S4QJB4_9NEOP|nr:jg24100 [Pararge aegeria aegeria]